MRLVTKSLNILNSLILYYPFTFSSVFNNFGHTISYSHVNAPQKVTRVWWSIIETGLWHKLDMDMHFSNIRRGLYYSHLQFISHCYIYTRVNLASCTCIFYYIFVCKHDYIHAYMYACLHLCMCKVFPLQLHRYIEKL